MHSETNRVVVVGAGQSGAECVAALRMSGHQGPITLIGEEPSYPYARPPLSKAYLSGKAGVEDLHIRPPATYEQQGIDVRVGTRVVAIDRAGRSVAFDDGTSLSYERLVLATGGRARRLPVPGLDTAPNVHYLRTLADVAAMRHRFVPGARLVVVGGGYVGLEVAAVARGLGLAVTVLEALPRVLARVTAPQVSAFYQRIHAEEGVEVRVDTAVTGFAFAPDGSVTSVELKSGETIDTDVVLVGIGLVPNVELAEESGLLVDNGIVVDEYCRTADPAILSVGDCTNHPCGENGGRRRLESVPNASEQARVAAATITGNPRPYTAVPWFWSDQYDVKLQTVGLSTGYDDVVIRGTADTGRSFAAFYLKDGAVRAADVISSPRDFTAAKKLVAQRAEISPASLQDLSVPLKQML
ncbi:NAD(P)/FAD-dependent oxidoreductase [Streptomyces sp. GbtcB7]|uniref:NAD(P)/FAD-dependent oxidoreductase n=1 Tax=Streptomyces sp. GbtcB7 TaxID=2824752 RepID=UPI001C30DC07|nr:FAD-dependent oxidoreductase [Streptomyces sp. GbtcB7]